jgi:transposase
MISTSAKCDERQQVLPLLTKLHIRCGGRGKCRSCPAEIQLDKGYDKQDLRNKLRRKGIKPRIPRRTWLKRKQVRGRKPAQLIDRWKVERNFGWLQRKFRRLCVRWERRMKYWMGFMELAVCWIWLGKLV